MKAVVVYEPGGAEQLVYTDVPRPVLRGGWSLVRVRAFGVNHSEIFTRQRLSPTVTFPRILGIECVGTVEETTDADRLPVGQRVVSLMGEMGPPLTAAMQSMRSCRMSRFIPWTVNSRGKSLRQFRRRIIRRSDL